MPTYAASYDCLGDQEAFSLKYSWELTVYFAGYVFPFINDLFTDRRFLHGFMRLFGQLGPINASVQNYLSAFFQWKKTHRVPPEEPVYFDFTELEPLAKAAETFYDVGVEAGEAKKILARQVASLKEFARFIGAHVASVVLDDERVLTHRRFVEELDINKLIFDPAEMRRRWAACAEDTELYPWSFETSVMKRFRAPESQPSARQPTASVGVDAA